MRPRPALVFSVAALASIGLLAGCAAGTEPETPSEVETAATTSGETMTKAPTESSEPTQTSDPIAQAAIPTVFEDADQALLYLIEEEKLAHDVYVALDELYGTGPFGNIVNAETAHQGALVPVLDARGLEDPRTGEPGTFTNPKIQDLYDALVEKGSASLEDAIEVGVLIEEKDLRDLQTAIEMETDPAAITAYENLLAGSENHLASFQARQ